MTELAGQIGRWRLWIEIVGIEFHQGLKWFGTRYSIKTESLT